MTLSDFLQGVGGGSVQGLINNKKKCKLLHVSFQQVEKHNDCFDSPGPARSLVQDNTLHSKCTKFAQYVQTSMQKDNCIVTPQ